MQTLINCTLIRPKKIPKQSVIKKIPRVCEQATQMVVRTVGARWPRRQSRHWVAQSRKGSMHIDQLFCRRGDPMLRNDAPGFFVGRLTKASVYAICDRQKKGVSTFQAKIKFRSSTNQIVDIGTTSGLQGGCSITEDEMK